MTFGMTSQKFGYCSHIKKTWGENDYPKSFYIDVAGTDSMSAHVFDTCTLAICSEIQIKLEVKGCEDSTTTVQ